MKLTGGLNTDVAHVDQPANTYRRARNMILDDLAGALANENAPLYHPAPIGPSNDVLENMEVCGQFKVPGDRVIYGIKAREVTGDNYYDASLEEQIIEFLPDGSTPTMLASGPAGTFGFDATTPFQGVGYVNGADDLVLVWTDGVTRPKYITYDTSTSTASEVFLVFPEANFPMARPMRTGANDTTGNILAGNYTFMLAYEVQSGTDNLTQYGPTMGAFQIGAEATDELKRFRGAAKMKFYGLDTNYEYARVYAVRQFNGTEYVYYADRFAITSDEMEWAYYGSDLGNAPAADALFIPRATYVTAETLGVSDDRLFMANLSTDNLTFEEGQAVANNITVKWTTDQEGLYADRWDLLRGASYDPFQTAFLNALELRLVDYTSLDWSVCMPNRNGEDNAQSAEGGQNQPDDWGGMLGGFMPGEVYALYIAFLRKDGTWSEAYHIPGGGDAGDFTDTSYLDTATVVAEDINLNKEYPANPWDLHVSGRCGYVENQSEEYDNTAIWAANGLDNLAVRHHLMPTAKQLWESTQTGYGGNSDLNIGEFENEWCNQTLGLWVENVEIDANLASKIQGYKIFYAKAETLDERRVKAYVPTWRWTHDNDADFNRLLRIYDPHLMSSKPQVIGWSIEEVYKQMSYQELRGHTMEDGTLDNYAYLPANVIYGQFDNENRESCLAVLVNQDIDHNTDWDAGYPGYFAGVQDTALFEYHPKFGMYGWHVQAVEDAANLTYPLGTDSLSIVNPNFTSALGGYHSKDAYNAISHPSFDWTERPDKSDTSYGASYERTSRGGTGSQTWYRADAEGAGDANGDLSTQAYVGWGGAMGSMSLIYADADDYFVDYAGQRLVATHDLVKVDGADTYSSNQVVRGGDTWITPVVVEFMAPDVGFEYTGFAQTYPLRESNDTIDYDFLGKVSYFTWSHIQPSKNDLNGTFTWQDFADDWGISTGLTPFNGETLNHYNIGEHWTILDENKSAFGARENVLRATNFPNRIIRSNKQNYESTKVAWTQFTPGDYYDNALGKESIRNIEDFQGDLIIHHGNAIFKTRSKFNLDPSGANVFIGTGDIFQAPPKELFIDAAGYAGLTHWSDTLFCRAGYIWVDRLGRRIFRLNQGLEEISAKGMLEYIRDEFTDLPTAGMTNLSADGVPTAFSTYEGGFVIGYDPQFERLLFTKRYALSTTLGLTVKAGTTLSYSLRNNCWASFHDYAPYQYFQTYNNLYFLDEIEWEGVVPTDRSFNKMGMFEVNGTNPGRRYDIDGNLTDPAPSFVDVTFNMGGPIAKVWSNFNWVTRSGEGEGSRGHEQHNVTFDRARLYNDTQLSQYSSAFRRSDNRWNWNEFKDDALETPLLPWFRDDNLGFNDDANILDLTKEWYERGKFISDYATIRLETLNTEGYKLYLTDVGASARKAYR